MELAQAKQTDPSVRIEIQEESEWKREQSRVCALVRDPLDRFRAQRSRGSSDPILDFLFEYYKLRPRHLEQWSPGLGIGLTGADIEQFLNRRFFAPLGMDSAEGNRSPGRPCVGLDIRLFPQQRRRSVQWIRDVLAATNERTPFFGCSGLHEWAMVFGEAQVRHANLPLRYARKDIDAIVRSHPIVCSHFDAFRFFAESAKPMNLHKPTEEGMPEMEQPGCLHSNMDIYRWAGKLYPWVSSAILADSFLLALRIREVDMRASPYDLAQFGLDPIRIETSSGKSEYRTYQQDFFREGRVLRQRLISAVDMLLNALNATTGAEAKQN